MTEPSATTTTTKAITHYETLLAEHFSWMLGGDIPAAAAQQTELLRDLGVTPAGNGATAVDLGCGPGTQSLALAALGFAPVMAVDTSAELLAELAAHVEESGAGIRPVHADLRTALREFTSPGTVSAVVCMGDTLTHLPTRADVTALLADAAVALSEGGHLVITYRDLTAPLHGTDRFFPVRATEDKLLTCFVEYADEETATVHDLLHTREGGTWQLRTGSYPKLRIAASWLESRCHEAGLTVRSSEMGQRGMRVLHAVRGGG
ncbi:class I SAM-dependent methyltransferase [Streptomyces sp. NBC_01381]|uniref:class I SAM-dependent methyltransferase n=1 Tax=Streptomyces sp. NBC_01381 TaxID=2903845 RepID=UPI002258E2DD|nr:class I SAM-dependent methyltransferase [Streptomyces sp. NBC_01381]MCX4665673.1 class I SAM-dependent methyltransferase [Streptomyces sp. NBC_01381]